MTAPTQAKIDAAVKRASFTIGMVEAGYSAPAEMVADARAILALAAERRAPGFIECCPACGEPRFYDNGDKGSDGGCAAGFDDGISTTLIKCPIRKPPTAAGEMAE